MEFKNKKPEYAKPTTGTGVVKVGEGRFSIEVTSYVGQDKKGNAEYEKELFKFKTSQLPETLDEVKNGKTYFISVKPDGKGSGEILQMRPASGVYTVSFAQFARERDDEDEVLIIEGDGKFGKYWRIVAELEVVAGEFKGIRYPAYLPLASEDANTGDPQFKFYWDDGVFTILVGKKSGQPVKMFKDLVHFMGVDEYQFKIEDGEDYEVDEVLLMVEKVAKKLKKKFVLVAEGGYPKSFTDSEEDADDVEPDEEDDDPKLAKKSKVVEEELEDETPAPKAKRKPKFDED